MEISVILGTLAEAARMKGQLVRAVRLYCVGKKFLELVGAWSAEDGLELGTILDTIRTELDDVSFNTAVEQGEAMTLEQAVEFALS